MIETAKTIWWTSHLKLWAQNASWTSFMSDSEFGIAYCHKNIGKGLLPNLGKLTWLFLSQTEVEVLPMFFCWMCQSLGLPSAASLAGLKTANKFTSPSRHRLHYLRLLVPDYMARANLSPLSSLSPLYFVQANLRMASFLPLEVYSCPKAAQWPSPALISGYILHA